MNNFENLRAIVSSGYVVVVALRKSVSKDGKNYYFYVSVEQNGYIKEYNCTEACFNFASENKYKEIGVDFADSDYNGQSNRRIVGVFEAKQK